MGILSYDALSFINIDEEDIEADLNTNVTSTNDGVDRNSDEEGTENESSGDDGTNEQGSGEDASGDSDSTDEVSQDSNMATDGSGNGESENGGTENVQPENEEEEESGSGEDESGGSGSGDEDESTLTISLYYSTTDVKVSSTSLKVDFNTFVSNVGGSLGLFIGFSVLGGFYFIYDTLQSKSSFSPWPELSKGQYS